MLAGKGVGSPQPGLVWSARVMVLLSVVNNGRPKVRVTKDEDAKVRPQKTQTKGAVEVKVRS